MAFKTEQLIIFKNSMPAHFYMNKINILYLVSTLKKSGPINILYGIINGLDKQKFAVLIVALSSEKSNSMYKEFQHMGCEIIDLHNSRLKGLLKNRKIIQSLVDQKKIQLCHSHGLRADIINSKLKRVRSFTTIHNIPYEDYTMKFGKIKGKMMAAKHIKVISDIDHPIACSNFISRWFSTNEGIETEMISNGIVTTDYQKSDGMMQSRQIELGLPKHKKIMLASGSLIKRKAPEVIIEAFHMLDRNDISLLFIGSGTLEERLRKQYESENIIFKGDVKNVYDYLDRSDYYVSASLSEGLPNSVLEAISMELPVLLSDIPAHKEIVGDDYPYLFNTKDIIGLKNKMIKLIDHKNDALLESFPTRIKQHFEASEMAGKYESLYLDECQITEK